MLKIKNILFVIILFVIPTIALAAGGERRSYASYLDSGGKPPILNVTTEPKILLAGQDLGFKLVGTAVGDDSRQNFAIIENQSTGNQGAYREGDRVGDVLIKKILSGSVVIGTKMGDQILSMGSAGRTGFLSSSGEVVHLDKKEVDSTLPDYRHLVQQIRVRPHFEAGKPGGLLIYGIEAGSIFARMGLNDGDIIVALNGAPFATTQPNVEFYDALKKGGTISLEIKRDESKMELHFEIQ